MSRYFWTTPDLAIIREHYPTAGVVACLERLPNRSRGAIHQQARKMGLFAPKGGPRRAAYESSDFIDAQIRRVYSEAPTKGAVRELARRINRPRSWVSHRAAKLGLALPRFKDEPWSEEEIRILEESTHLEPKGVKARLARAGYNRTVTAITVKRKRLKLNYERPDLSASELGLLMGVDNKTVTRWIEKGWLKARRREAMYDIRPADVRTFVIDYTHEVDIRKVDKWWFVDLLSGTSRAKGGLREAV